MSAELPASKLNILKIFFVLLVVSPSACQSDEAEPQEPLETSVTVTSTDIASASPTAETSELAEITASETICFRLLGPESASEVPSSGLVSFDWEEKAGASSYQLQLELPNGNSEFHNANSASLDKYMASLPLAGSYSWRVMAFDSGGQPICFSERFGFTKVQYVGGP